jgi:hypothetical protein
MSGSISEREISDPVLRQKVQSHKQSQQMANNTASQKDFFSSMGQNLLEGLASGNMFNPFSSSNFQSSPMGLSNGQFGNFGGNLDNQRRNMDFIDQESYLRPRSSFQPESMVNKNSGAKNPININISYNNNEPENINDFDDDEDEY